MFSTLVSNIFDTFYQVCIRQFKKNMFGTLVLKLFYTKVPNDTKVEEKNQNKGKKKTNRGGLRGRRMCGANVGKGCGGGGGDYVERKVGVRMGGECK